MLAEQSKTIAKSVTWALGCGGAADRSPDSALSRRSDAPALKFFGLWLALFAASGVGGVLLWGTWWAVPFIAVYGVLYESKSPKRALQELLGRDPRPEND